MLPNHPPRTFLMWEHASLHYFRILSPKVCPERRRRVLIRTETSYTAQSGLFLFFSFFLPSISFSNIFGVYSVSSLPLKTTVSWITYFDVILSLIHNPTIFNELLAILVPKGNRCFLHSFNIYDKLRENHPSLISAKLPFSSFL